MQVAAKGGSVSPKTMAIILAEGANIRVEAASVCQRVEDNAFHLSQKNL
jgi:hypothetical protein